MHSLITVLHYNGWENFSFIPLFLATCFGNQRNASLLIGVVPICTVPFLNRNSTGRFIAYLTIWPEDQSIWEPIINGIRNRCQIVVIDCSRNHTRIKGLKLENDQLSAIGHGSEPSCFLWWQANNSWHGSK